MDDSCHVVDCNAISSLNIDMKCSGIALRIVATLLITLLLNTQGYAQEASDVVEEATVDWSHDRCEYILITKKDGFGVISQFSAERMKAGDKITAPFYLSVNSFKKFTHVGTGETGMLRGTAFGLTRAQALKKIQGICKKVAPQE